MSIMTSQEAEAIYRQMTRREKRAYYEPNGVSVDWLQPLFYGWTVVCFFLFMLGGGVGIVILWITVVSIMLISLVLAIVSNLVYKILP